MQKDVIPGRMSEAAKAVIPGRMSEAGFPQTLVNPETGFRHSDPESIHRIYGNPRRTWHRKSCHSGQDAGSRKSCYSGQDPG
ncbi:hypothetical protein QUF72_18050 [Desulfobacterales bacterium HSG2]|nr:hypothetical protein [Desulfobacterales bacterium HSG2]